jgi:pyruvate/2-oxoacid:ferredoxin oxidoreductase alpha subunit
VPFIHFFDGFRTSHEVSKIALLPDEVLRARDRRGRHRAFRARAMSPDRPTLRGTAQNPDVYFQGREAVNRFYDAACRRSCRRRWTRSRRDRAAPTTSSTTTGTPRPSA